MQANPERPMDARAAFGWWASLQTGAPRDPLSLIENVEQSADHIGLLSTDIRGRRVVWKSVPAASRSRITVPSIAMERVDPWDVESASLRDQSDHIAVCESCDGQKKVRCSVCGGAGKLICATCGGQRKVYGYAANGARRLLNCTSCHGKGQSDCTVCRRGITSCHACAGEGRVQRWMEIERWQRSMASTHPDGLARQIGWTQEPSDSDVRRDCDLVSDYESPHQLTAADIASVPTQWLRSLAPTLQHGERIVRQRLRIARLPMNTVHYRVGRDNDQVTFTGHRFLPPPLQRGSNAFARRASRLRALGWMLIFTGILVAAVSFGRGTFYWSLPTLASVISFGAALASLYIVAAEWTAGRVHLRRSLLAAALLIIFAFAFAIVALPRLKHAQHLIVDGELDRAESELGALGDKAPASAWAELRLARLYRATAINDARKLLAQIPPALPQHIAATSAVDDLILHTATAQTKNNDFAEAAASLALLSDSMRRTSNAVAAARAVYIPLIEGRIARSEWAAAADAIVAARGFGMAPADLEPFTTAIRHAGLDAVARTTQESDAMLRLRQRIDAEKILVAWERASGDWGSPPLIALRTAMARDVAIAERTARRRRVS